MSKFFLKYILNKFGALLRLVNNTKCFGVNQMTLIGRFLRLKVSSTELVRNFENFSHSILSQIESKKPFYTVLFTGEDLPANALEVIKPAFEEVGKIESRKVQSRKLLSKYYESKQDEICFDFFSKDCPDLMLVAYARSLIDGGDEFLSSLAIKTEQQNENHEQFAKTAKAYFKKKYFFEVYKNNVFLTVIKFLFGDIDDPEVARRFELIVKEHVKKLGVELNLIYSNKEDQIVPTIAQGYDFTETKKRDVLIARFIQGVELNSHSVIDNVCEDFPKLLAKNYETFNKITRNIELK